MNSFKLARVAVSELTDDPGLSVLLKDPPMAVVMPVFRDHSKVYLTITAVLIDEASTLRVVTSFCQRTVGILESKGLLDGLEGVEIIPGGVLDGRVRRILRLSVLRQDIGLVKELTEANLRSSNLPGGMTCLLYEKEIS